MEVRPSPLGTLNDLSLDDPEPMLAIVCVSRNGVECRDGVNFGVPTWGLCLLGF